MDEGHPAREQRRGRADQVADRAATDRDDRRAALDAGARQLLEDPLDAAQPLRPLTRRDRHDLGQRQGGEDVGSHLDESPIDDREALQVRRGEMVDAHHQSRRVRTDRVVARDVGVEQAPAGGAGTDALDEVASHRCRRPGGIDPHVGRPVRERPVGQASEPSSRAGRAGRSVAERDRRRAAGRCARARRRAMPRCRAPTAAIGSSGRGRCRRRSRRPRPAR